MVFVLSAFGSGDEACCCGVGFKVDAGALDGTLLVIEHRTFKFGCSSES